MPIFSKFADASLQYATAWNRRGTDFANRTSEQQMSEFKKSLRVTEIQLRLASEELRDTPIWYNLMLATQLDLHGAAHAQEIFDGGVARWPNYYDFYDVFLTRLVPRWGGSWEVVDAFIDNWTRKRETVEKTSLYSRLYWSVHGRRVDPDATLMKWPRMKASLTDLLELYPTVEHRNIALGYACHQNDLAMLKELLSQVPPHEWYIDHWPRGVDMTLCQKQAALPDARR